VLVNVVVRDKAGNVVRGLTAGDFSITEDGRPQTITSFDFEDITKSVESGTKSVESEDLRNLGVEDLRAGSSTNPQLLKSLDSAPPTDSTTLPDLHGRRLMVLFFDLSSMPPEEIGRAVKAAHSYVDERLSPADLIAVASFSTSLRVDQD